MNSHLGVRKGDFRLTNHAGRLFSLLLSLYLMLNLTTSALAANPTSRQQVYNFAVSQTQKDINQLAKQHSWKNHSVKLDVFIPSDIGGYARCGKPLVIYSSSATGTRSDLTRLRYGIRCNDKNSWEILVTVKPNVSLPIILTKGSIERGSIINNNDVELKRYNISHARQGFLTSLDEVIGLTAKRRLRPGQPILPSQLEQPIVIKRGQQVTMIAEQGGIEIRAIGEAMSDGYKGQVIKVRNINSKKIISASVEDEGIVKIIPR